MRSGADALIGELGGALRVALEAMRVDREISYECFTEGSTRVLSAEEAGTIRLMDERIASCEGTLARAEAWCRGTHG